MRVLFECLAVAIMAINAINGVAFGQAAPGAPPAKDAVKKERREETPAAREQKPDLKTLEQQKSQPLEIPGEKAAPKTASPVGRPAASDSVDSAPQNLGQKIDSLQKEISSLAKKIDNTNSFSWRDISYLVTAIVAIGSLFLTYRASVQNLQISMTQMQRNVNDEKAKALQKKIDDFFGPLVQLRNTSNLLYEVFRSRHADPANPKKFRTLTALLSGVKFEGNDKALLEEIIKIGEETEQLIFKSAGLVDEDLQELLGKATTHYRIIRLANKELLKGEPAKFELHVFPNELDGVIRERINAIRSEIDQLLAIQVPRDPLAAVADDLISVRR